MAAPKTLLNFREWVASISAPWLQGKYSAPYVGVVLSLTADLASAGLRQVLRMPWLLDPESPDDVLPLIGKERRMPAYPGESAASYRARLWGAGEAYRFAGSALAITTQLAAAGYPNAEVRFYPGTPGPNGALDYWSQFWVWFPVGSHPVTGAGEPWAGFSWGDGTLYGVSGATADFFATIRGIVRKWKPVDWICRGFEFSYGDPVWGGFSWGDGTVYGGTTVIQF